MERSDSNRLRLRIRTEDYGQEQSPAIHRPFDRVKGCRGNGYQCFCECSEERVCESGEKVWDGEESQQSEGGKGVMHPEL